MSAQRRDPLTGMPAGLRAAVDGDHEALTAEQASLVRRAAGRYRSAMRAVRDLAEAGDYPGCVTAARTALAELPDDETRLEGPHITLRMCQWIAADRYRDLDAIAHADGDAAQVVNRRVARAFAGMGLR